jgi:hypothetical protein
MVGICSYEEYLKGGGVIVSAAHFIKNTDQKGELDEKIFFIIHNTEPHICWQFNGHEGNGAR